MITTWESGPREGQPVNDRFKEIRGMLKKYTYPDRELAILEAQIIGAVPKRALKRIQEEKENSPAK